MDLDIWRKNNVCFLYEERCHEIRSPPTQPVHFYGVVNAIIGSVRTKSELVTFFARCSSVNGRESHEERSFRATEVDKYPFSCTAGHVKIQFSLFTRHFARYRGHIETKIYIVYLYIARARKLRVSFLTSER